MNEPRSVRDFALHRFSLGASRQSSADALVDSVVALESLLLPYDSSTRHADLSYRFRVHGAHYLARTKRERPEIDKQLRDLYNPAPVPAQSSRAGSVRIGDWFDARKVRHLTMRYMRVDEPS